MCEFQLFNQSIIYYLTTLMPEYKYISIVLMIAHFRGSENNDLSTTESKSDEWLDRLHSGAIWGDSRAIGLRISSIGQGQGLTEILKDIEQIVSKQCFLISDKVHIQFIKHVTFIIINTLTVFWILLLLFFNLEPRNC